jgi:uncharacterized membrane protein
MSRVLRRAFVASASAWAAALLLATFAASRSNPGTLPRAFALAVYGLGGQVCHQLAERSFHPWGAKMPVCARCTGIYVAGAIVALTMAGRKRTRALPSILARRTALLVSIVPTAVTLIYEWTTGAAPGNWIRALAGAPIGAVVSWVVVAGEDPGER